MENRQIAERIIEANMKTSYKIKDIGQQMFRLETNFGLPVDMFIDKFEKGFNLDFDEHFTLDQKITILDEYLSEKTIHNINSGLEMMSERHIKLIKENNDKMMILIKTEKIIIDIY